jgi:hypothetical protein
MKIISTKYEKDVNWDNLKRDLAVQIISGMYCHHFFVCVINTQ